jgi:hypothetical protein
MAYAQADLDALKTAVIAVASGPQEVRFSDGRSVRYNTPDQILAVIRVVEAEINMQAKAASGLIRRRFGAFRSGA